MMGLRQNMMINPEWDLTFLVSYGEVLFAVITNEFGINIYFQLKLFMRVDDDTLVLGSLQVFT